MNNQFFKSLKQVYGSMKGNNIVEKLPEKEVVEKLQKNIQQSETGFNDKAEWLQQLGKTSN